MTAAASFQERFGLTVNAQNVLGVRAVILEEANRLQDVLYTKGQQAMMPRLGGDPVSHDMSREFNAVTTQLLARAQQHVNSLTNLGAELAAAAKAYGLTEEQISASFSPTVVGQLPPLARQVTGMGATSRSQVTSLSELITGGHR